jgi:hypothetical protein
MRKKYSLDGGLGLILTLMPYYSIVFHMSERANITRLLGDTNTVLMTNRVISKSEFFGDQAHIHLFLGVIQPRVVVHLQGYPTLSTPREAYLWARVLDMDILQSLRIKGTRSVGDEMEAIIDNFPNFKAGLSIPYSPQILINLLAENIPSLGEVLY